MSALERFDARFHLPPLPGANAPIFVMAAGWRSGSTLVQRLCCGTDHALVWGEPYGQTMLVQQLARAAFTVRDAWPVFDHIAPPRMPRDLGSQWLANVYPEARAFRDSFRAQLDTLLAAPATARGYGRWGMKTVRLGAVEATFLRWVYPDARFVFVVRNPWDAWRSAKGGAWWLQWPDRVITSAAEYATLWNELASGFCGYTHESGALLRYEDLTRPGFALGALGSHLQIPNLDPAPLAKRIRGMQGEPLALTSDEVDAITHIAGQTASLLGYQAPATSPRPHSTTPNPPPPHTADGPW